jgi:hypothetical protein
VVSCIVAHEEHAVEHASVASLVGLVGGFVPVVARLLPEPPLRRELVLERGREAVLGREARQCARAVRPPSATLPLCSHPRYHRTPLPHSRTVH